MSTVEESLPAAMGAEPDEASIEPAQPEDEAPIEPAQPEDEAPTAALADDVTPDYEAEPASVDEEPVAEDLAAEEGLALDPVRDGEIKTDADGAIEVEPAVKSAQPEGEAPIAALAHDVTPDDEAEPAPAADEPLAMEDGLVVESASSAQEPTTEEPPAAEAVDAPNEPPATQPEPLPARTVGRAIADAVVAAGARFAFTVPGESFLGLIDGLVEAGVRVVPARHEGGASFMAEAAAQLTGRPQLVLATRAVGAANAAIGIHTARQDSVPLVALIGQVKREHRGREAFQETDLATSIGSLALWAGEARDPADAVRLIGEGLRRQARGRQGPILLSLPEDILDELVDGGTEVSPAQAAGSADRSAVRQVLHLLAASERGVILAGGGVLRARASKRLTALSEAMAVPVIAAWRRPDVFPNAHPNYLGMTGYWAASTVRQRMLDADVILVLGCRLSEVASFGYSVPAPTTRWAHVDLEPRASGHGLSAPSLALAADAARFLDAAWSELRSAALDAEMRGRRERGIAEDRAAWEAVSRVDEEAWDGPGVHPGRVITTLQRILPADSLISIDAGNFGGWAARGYRFVRPGTFVGPTSGAMGYGLPAAIAASLLRPDRPAVALCGDGGFAMTISELETAVREHARPIAIVFDNQRFGTIHMHQERDGHSVAGTELGAIDFAAAARAFGATGYTVETDAEFEPALVSALAARVAAVIHLRVDPRWMSVDQTPGSPQGVEPVGRDIASAP